MRVKAMSISEFSDSSTCITLTVSASKTDMISELKSVFNSEVSQIQLSENSKETFWVKPLMSSEFSELQLRSLSELQLISERDEAQQLYDCTESWQTLILHEISSVSELNDSQQSSECEV